MSDAPSSSPPPLHDGDLTDSILESTWRLAEIAALVGAREPIATCEPWTMRQLVAHVISGLSGWYPHNLTHGDRPTDLATAWDAQPPLPRGNAERLDHLRRVADQFVELVDSTDLDTPCFVFGDRRVARGWVLRAATECAIHLQDAETTVGDPEPFTPERASISIDETLRYMWPGALYIRGDLGATRVPDVPITIHAADLAVTWMVEKSADGLAVARTRTDDLSADLAVSGNQSAVIPWLWGRPTDHSLELIGEPDLISAWNLSART